MSTLPETTAVTAAPDGPYGYDNRGRWFCAEHSPDRANDAARLMQARCRELLELLTEQNLRDVESFAASCGGRRAARLMPQLERKELKP